MQASQEPSRGPAPDDAACEEVTHLLSRFVTGELRSDEKRRMRAHVLECEACRDMYRGAMAGAASLGRRVRMEREERTRSQRHESLRSRAFRATGDPRRRRRFGLRLALLPAGIALLAILLRGRVDVTPLVAEWGGGEASVAGAELGPDRDRYVLSAGDWCETGPDGEIRIRSSSAGDPPDDVVMSLGPSSQLRVEDVAALRLRLQQGRLRLRGRGTVASSHGVLVLDGGEATLDLAGPGFALECLAGSAGWVGPAGERRLAAGEALRATSMLAGVRQ